jgi:hypothetical protein
VPLNGLVQLAQHAFRFFEFTYVGQVIEFGKELTHSIIAFGRVEDPLENVVAVVPLGRNRVRDLPDTILPGREQANVAGLYAGDDLWRVGADDKLTARERLNQRSEYFPLPRRMQMELNLVNADDARRLSERRTRTLEHEATREICGKEEGRLLAA